MMVFADRPHNGRHWLFVDGSTEEEVRGRTKFEPNDRVSVRHGLSKARASNTRLARKTLKGGGEVRVTQLWSKIAIGSEKEGHVGELKTRLADQLTDNAYSHDKRCQLPF
ncbi:MULTISPECIES: hypothetical protein [Rhizobium/Agrobacterium group]|jgi:prepilin-type processing-associated H-X9-DG protein|uniref:Uncharacterized protein n=1 Tax=Rhizobium nepotum 39/7 TaxID=1368418 RepID=A0ABR5CK11_9HYPH|nr:hypothetical protein [Rhizobium nepotum]KJF65132.1 hypothetical protein RS75_24895 [Rhizobium nepotum 39/7]